MPVNIEFVGGPADGQKSTLRDEDMDAFSDGNVPDVIEIRDEGVRSEAGVYRVTRSVTRQGRLIYRFFQNG